MREALALIQASWRTQRSYRVSIVLSILSLGVTVLPVYFVSKALQPYAAASIANQGGNYFGFLVIGFIALDLREHDGELDSGCDRRGDRKRYARGAACRRAHRFRRCSRGWWGTASCGRR